MEDYNIFDIPGIPKLESAYKEMMKDYKDAKKRIINSFLKKKSKFKKGDFIYNVLGVIKVEEITSSYSPKYNVESVHIIYKGYAYRRDKGRLLRTKERGYKEIHCYDSSNIKKIDLTKWKLEDE